MRFWDSSAIVPLLVSEDATERVRAAYAADPQIMVWWGTRVECASALSRREREGVLDAAATIEALQLLDDFSQEWFEIAPADAVRTVARRLLRVHPLRAADALQLAAAIVAAEHEPSSLELVGLDDRLNDAARREGFRVRVP